MPDNRCPECLVLGVCDLMPDAQCPMSGGAVSGDLCVLFFSLHSGQIFTLLMLCKLLVYNYISEQDQGQRILESRFNLGTVGGIFGGSGCAVERGDLGRVCMGVSLPSPDSFPSLLGHFR